MVVQNAQGTTDGYSTSYQNLLLQLCFTSYSSHTSNPYHISTNVLLCLVHPIGGNWSI